jgi:micrococcal nuclease
MTNPSSKGRRSGRGHRTALWGAAAAIAIGALAWIATGRPPARAQRAHPPDGAFEGKVVAVIDGDTLDVMYEGAAVRVRLAEIDCPEKKQPFGQKAKQRASALASGRTVRVEVRTKDRYGRAVARVVLPDGGSLNEALLRDGFAWWYRRYSKDDRLGAIEKEAREAKRGLWSQPDPKPPWQFRHGARKHREGTSQRGGG